MISFKTDLKKMFYFCVAALVFVAIAGYFTFFMSIEGHIEKNYLQVNKSDVISGSKARAYQDILSATLVFVFMSIVFFSLSFVFSIVTYNIFIKGPFMKLRNGLRGVRDGDFEMRIPMKGLSEVASLFEDFNNMVKAVQRKVAIKHYVSNSTEKMVEILNTGEITAQPRRKLVTILFSDVRGFTSFSEQNDPLVVISTINEIFNIQVGIIKKNSGDIDKFIGDSIMVEFPSPSLAFKSATEIQNKMAAYNKKRQDSLTVGIGINYGEAIVGAIGAGEQYNWTMIGNTVNVASRLCGAAESGAVLVSASVYEKLKIKRECKEAEIRVKGISKAVKAYVYEDFA
jgi:adenylate cyclase